MVSEHYANMAGRPKSKPAGPVGSAIAELRTAAGMTQQQLAHFLGVAVPSVGRWETVRVPEKKYLKQFLEMAQSAKRPDLANVFRSALLEDAGVAALISMSQIALHLGLAQNRLAHLTTPFQEFRKQPLTEAETMKIADDVWAAVSRARGLAEALDLNSPHFGKQVIDKPDAE